MAAHPEWSRPCQKRLLAAIPLILLAIVLALPSAAAQSHNHYETDPNNVIKHNEILYLNGQPIFFLPRVRDLMLRTCAATLLGVNMIVWMLTFRHKHSAVSVLIFCFIASYLLGVLCNLLPKIGAAPNSPYLTIGVGVGAYMLSSECFIWVLYLRFSMVIPFKRNLRFLTLGWLICESLCVLANWIIWLVEAVTHDGATDRAMIVYFYVSIAQVVTAFGLSGYFIVIYYRAFLALQTSLRSSLSSNPSLYPPYSTGHITRRRNTRTCSLFSHFYTTGILYLILESLLHCSYVITSNTIIMYRTGVTSILTAVRYGVFLLFVLSLREEESKGRDKMLGYSADGMCRSREGRRERQMRTVGIRASYVDATMGDRGVGYVTTMDRDRENDIAAFGYESPANLGATIPSVVENGKNDRRTQSNRHSEGVRKNGSNRRIYDSSRIKSPRFSDASSVMPLPPRTSAPTNSRQHSSSI
ncbi:hypothetical protein BC832DRAFT_321334 [Gaertneriomyces semiglobifer]|nr:hypothetical protein BC832DRAFT_321334 [Gaertneriomyces semiglobifer]